jgi:protein TonB
MAAPNVSHPLNTTAAGQPAEAPAIQSELTPSGNPFGGALGSQAKPAAPVPAVHSPTGGMVQQPRLIRAAPLFYPQLAKSSRVAGDVVVDALIDPTGNVTTVKATSGPVLLQQAAMDTVRHWKYEPARLDGQAVSMHLSVTVRFRFN